MPRHRRRPSIDADGVVACLDASPPSGALPPTCASTTGRSSSPTRGRLVPLQRDRHRLHRSRLAWQNAWIESFNGRLRDEYLNGQRFDTLFEAQVLLEDWRIDYNMNRPHSAHGWLTPAEFAEAWLNRQQLTTRIAAGPAIGVPSAPMWRAPDGTRGLSTGSTRTSQTCW